MATLYLVMFTAWVAGAATGWAAWPGIGWVFFAGMEFEYLTIFVISPWIEGRDPYEI